MGDESQSAYTSDRMAGFSDSQASAMTPEPHAQRGIDWFVPTLLLGIAGFLYLNLFALPNVPFLQAGDQIYFWVFAQRMFHGEQVYRDFFQFTPPGTDLLYLLFLKIFGVRIWLPNATDVALGVALCWACFGIARQIMTRNLALLATLLFLVLIYGGALNGTHHWFSVLAILCAARIGLLGINTTRLACIGALLGLAGFFTQTHGLFAAAGFALFLIAQECMTDRNWRKLGNALAVLFGVFAVVLATLNGYFANAIGIEKIWYFQVSYSRQYLAFGQHPPLLGIGPVPNWHGLPTFIERVFIYLALPIVYGLVLVYIWRNRRRSIDRERKELLLLCFIGLSLLLEVSFSPNYVRVYAVSMPGIILLVWILGRSQRVWRHAVVLAWIGIACLGVQQTVSRHHRASVVVVVPTGSVAAPPDVYEKLVWGIQHTRPGQFFFQGTWPGLYLPLGLRNPAYLSEMTANESTRPEDVQRTVQELDDKQVQYVLWTEYNDYPEAEYQSAYHLSPLRDYLHDRYRRVHVFSDQDEIWERK
jgi:hypothetical protein